MLQIILIIFFSENGTSCFSNCNCDFVKYSPICGEDGNTYISPCHAGCLEQSRDENGLTYYTNCSCISAIYSTSFEDSFEYDQFSGGQASSGACPVDCQFELILFMITMCLLQFFGSTGRAGNFLISVRCVKEEDKTLSMGIAVTITSAFAFIPSPVIFGWLIDQTCAVWGKTCEGTGNCWQYNIIELRYMLNLLSVFTVVLGVLCDIATWYYMKNLKIFDDQLEDKTNTVE